MARPPSALPTRTWLARVTGAPREPGDRVSPDRAASQRFSFIRSPGLPIPMISYARRDLRRRPHGGITREREEIERRPASRSLGKWETGRVARAASPAHFWHLTPFVILARTHARTNTQAPSSESVNICAGRPRSRLYFQSNRPIVLVSAQPVRHRRASHFLASSYSVFLASGSPE